MTDPEEFPPGFAEFQASRARYFRARAAAAAARRGHAAPQPRAEPLSAHGRPRRTSPTSRRRRRTIAEGAHRRRATGDR